MVKFAANLTMMFNEVEFLRRFSLAAASGFKAVEFLFPYPYTADQLKALLEDNRLELVFHNSPAGDWQAGERGIACLPDRTGEFRDGVSQAIEYAKTLGCKRLASKPISASSTTCSWPTILGVTNQGAVRYTTRSCFAESTSWDTRAGLDASTSRLRIPAPA